MTLQDYQIDPQGFYKKSIGPAEYGRAAGGSCSQRYEPVVRWHDGHPQP